MVDAWTTENEPPDPNDLTIAVIGGGGREWVPKITMDLALAGDLHGEVRLFDIDPESAERNARFGNWVSAHEEATTEWFYQAFTDRAAALDGADFVFTSTQYNPAETNAKDLEITKKYGILHPVTHSVGPGGHARSMRQIPVYREFGEAIKTHCPDAWVFNYSNPMTTITRSLYDAYPEINALGFCHEVGGFKSELVSLIEKYLDPAHTPNREEIEVDITGINHFTWLTSAKWQGIDLFSLVDHHIEQPGTVRVFSDEEMSSESYFVDNQQVTYELYRRFGALPAAGDRHLAEFSPWFVRGEDPSALHRWGIRRTPASYRRKHWQDVDSAQDYRVDQLMEDPDDFSIKRSHEVAVESIRALCGGEPFITSVNLPNVGQAPDLPRNAVVETNVRLSGNTVTPLVAGELPPAVRNLIRLHIENQELLIEADGDLDVAFQAFLNDPQVMGLHFDRAQEMFCELMEAHREYLGEWDFSSSVMNGPLPE